LQKKRLSREERRLLEEVVRRRERLERVDFEDLLFGPQLAFITDPCRFKAAVCSRRAGKTYGLVLYMLKEASRRGFCQIPYITLTRAQGKRNIWLDLQQLDQQLELGARFNNNELTCTLPNGSVIFICGANDETEIQRLRGGKYPLAVIDEAQSFRPFIRGLLRDILEPAVADYRGTICMTGTPGPACAGFYYDVTTGQIPEAQKWSLHHWTVLDNPHHAYNAEDVEELRIMNGWTKDNPTFLREWLGLWVQDDSRQVYKFNAELNVCYSVPHDPEELTYVLGIDLGFQDSTAFVVLGYNERTGRCYVIESHKEAGMIPSAVAARVDRYASRFPFADIVADSGGFGKGYVEEMKQRWALPVRAAEKARKYAFIELLNGDLQAGVLQFVHHRNQKLIDEMSTLLWVEDDEGNADHTKIDDRYDDHLCDALLYGWRACRQYFFDPLENGPKEGSREWAEARHREMEAEVERQVLGDPNQSWWEQGWSDGLEAIPSDESADALGLWSLFDEL
jgi:hypothetical protein